MATVKKLAADNRKLQDDVAALRRDLDALQGRQASAPPPTPETVAAASNPPPPANNPPAPSASTPPATERVKGAKHLEPKKNPEPTLTTLTPKAVRELQTAYEQGLLSPGTLDQIDPAGQVGEVDEDSYRVADSN